MIAAEYAYLNARVNLLAGKLLEPGQVDALIDRTGDDTAGGVDRQERTAGLMHYIGDLDQNNVTLLLQDLAVLIRPLSGEARELLRYWAHRFELNNLKVIIRGKMAGQPQQAIEGQLLDMGRFTSLPLAELLQSDSAAELLRHLEQTPFAELARQARHLLEQGEALFALDAALDRRYFAGLSRRSGSIDNTSGGFLRGIIGSIIDRVNLVWLLRYRFAYRLPPSQAYYLLIPASNRLSAQQLQQLSQQPTFEDVLGNLAEPYAGMLAGARNTTEVTLRLEQETWRVAAHALNHSVFNVARALAYLVLRERDLRRLRAIVRGHDVQMDAGMIRAALGLHDARAASGESGHV
ncbi:V-type ATP synthase subunit C [Sideroxyarcus emersonii]|uniref:V-type ATP synthase subunit C n=1 Tax=Sideroxyarcus emersonii TaxID=2764705 RepID=A0AAN2BZ43_9PROT|nr:V-type ATPase subunit [Sideroxyarcus emersonii]BCK87412.1 V-type ATP synthase subunit C [Sideroxyarcus emersonii]